MAAKKKSDVKDPWPGAARKRLSASRRKGGKEPRGFFLDADEAFAALGGTGPAPATLSPEEEDERALRFRHVSWKSASGRVFTDEAWNPLIALWTQRADWNFVFDRLLTADGALKPDLGSSDAGAPWYGVRRYLHAASDAAFAQAVARVQPVFERYTGKTDQFERLTQRDYMAFAFDRAGWADRLLSGYLERDEGLAEGGALMAATTDAALAQAVMKKWGGGDTHLYFVFDLVESQGAGALPLLEAQKPYDAPRKKRLAQAVEIAEALRG